MSLVLTYTFTKPTDSPQEDSFYTCDQVPSLTIQCSEATYTVVVDGETLTFKGTHSSFHGACREIYEAVAKVNDALRSIGSTNLLGIK